MTVLVTGASGFVGGALLHRLGERGEHGVRAAVRDPGAALPAGIEKVTMNLDDGRGVDEAVRGVDAVVHLAARVHVMNDSASDPLAEFRRINTLATKRLAEQAAAAGVRRFIFVSSVKAAGETGCFREEDRPAPEDAYGISKLEAEIALQEIAQRTRMEVTIVRPPLVYGPGVRANFAALIRAVRAGVPLPLARVRNRRSMVALDNLTDFLVVCLDHPAAANETFFVSDDDDLSTDDLVRRLARALGRHPRLVPVPIAVLTLAAAVVGQQAALRRLISTLQVDTGKARARLAWTPPVSVDEGLRRAVQSSR